MSDKELQAVSREDLEMFKALVTDFYRRPWEESYFLLRAEIRKRLLRRGTNRTYVSTLRGEVDDLVTRVVIRYSRVYGKIRRAGREIESFEAMLEDRVRLVCYEVLRKYPRHLTEIRVDAPDAPELSATAVRVDRALEEAEERELLNKCLMKCLRELPAHARRVLIEYSDTETYPPGERTQMRLNLALREAGLSADRATPEQIFNARRKLNTAVSRWRSKHLQPCKEKCLRREASARRDAGAGRTTED